MKLSQGGAGNIPVYDIETTMYHAHAHPVDDVAAHVYHICFAHAQYIERTFSYVTARLAGQGNAA